MGAVPLPQEPVLHLVLQGGQVCLKLLAEHFQWNLSKYNRQIGDFLGNLCTWTMTDPYLSAQI